MVHVLAVFYLTAVVCSVFRSLLQAYSDYFQPSWFTEEAYLWAVELWNAYAIQVGPRVSRSAKYCNLFVLHEAVMVLLPILGDAWM